jgi:hypothetical protein
LQNIPESKKVYDSLDNIANMVSDFIFNWQYIFFEIKYYIIY